MSQAYLLQIFIVVYIFLFVLCAVYDFVTLTIPNYLVVSIALLFFDIDRFLYAIDRSTDELLQIDPADGHPTVVGDTGTIWGVTYGMTSIDLGLSAVSRVDPTRSHLHYR